MSSPFDKVFDPNADIDLSLFSHIHSDAFLAGTFELQGNFFNRTTRYLERYCHTTAGAQREAQVLQRMKRLVEIEKEIERIKGRAVHSKPAAEIELKAFCNQLSIELLTQLKMGEYLTLPGGWDSTGPGHSMVYQFKRTGGGLEFYVHNAGAGIQYHEQRSDTDRELYYPVQAYHIPLPADNKKIAGFLQDLMLPRMKELREAKDVVFDGKRLYEEVLPRIHFLNARLIPIQGGADHAFTAGQLSGTCSERALHQMLKQNFKTLAEYQRFIYQFKRYALDDYMRVLERNGQISDRRVQAIVRRAINTLVRTLNISGVFSDTFIANERGMLLAYREKLAKMRANSIVLPVAHTAVLPVNTTTVLGNQALTLKPIIQQPHVVSSPKVPPQVVVCGGAGLLDQLTDFDRECARLKNLGQHAIIVERLEALFASFPLPDEAETFHLPIDFYQDINKGNELHFYNLIEDLQLKYLDACRQISSETVLPRKLVTGLSIVSVVDYVTNQLPRNKPGSASNHDAIKALLGRFFVKNRNNPFYATNHPILDARLKKIQSLYPENPYLELIEYYSGILDSEPDIKEWLLARFIPPANDDFARLLRERGYQALYYFTENFAVLSKDPFFQALTNKFNKQSVIERCVLKSMDSFWSSGISPDQRIQIELAGKTIQSRSVMYNVMWSSHDRSIVTHKYGLTENLPAGQALTLDYAEFREENVFEKSRSDNHTQLFPTGAARIKALDMASKATNISRQIEQREIFDRQFFHLRASVQNQIKLTLDYFQLHLSKLSDRASQIYLEANLFEPGLLVEELDNPEFLEKIEHFIDEGLKQFSDRGLTSQHSLFFIRLGYLVYCYAAECKPMMAYAKLNKLQQRLTNLLQIDEKNEVSIKQTLHQYQFLTAMARLKLKPGGVSPSESETIIELALPSYLYMNANINQQAFVDTSNRFELELVKSDFKQHVILADPRQIGRITSLALTNLGLGKVVSEAKKADGFYHLTMENEGNTTDYRVDVERGLVFNNHGMAFSPVPLEILNHPIIRFLNIKKFDPCFASSDGLCFEVGEPKFRFIRRSNTAQFRLQREWTVGGVTAWYELNTLNAEQGVAYHLESWNYDFLMIPAILKQRDNQIWINCQEAKTFIITEDHRPLYSYSEGKTAQQIRQLDAIGNETGLNLCLEKTWLHTKFAKFEDAAFITVCQQHVNLTDTFQIKFGRYNFTILAGIENGEWVYRLQEEPSYTLVGDVDVLLAGVVGLVFEDRASGQRMSYLPMQQFVPKKELSVRSEFYNLQQDTTASIPKEVMGKLARQGAATGLLPWQYTASERFIRYQLNKDDAQPQPETPRDALYLCYVFLGSQQPEKAWAVLEDCAKRLGGLKGTIEELEILSWIINALPKTLKDEDLKAVISTPAYVACQLKALALFTGTFTPDKVISFPPKTFDAKTKDGRYQEECWQNLQNFHAGLNQTIFLTYTRHQSMQRHMEHEYLLTDNEKKSLLDYYHFHLPGDEPKALGALGYEWQVLGLKALKKEYEALKAQEITKGTLPAGYQRRLTEIDTFLKKAVDIRKHHSELVLVPLDLSIPASFKGSTYTYPGSVYQIISPWVEDVSKCPAATPAQLLAALTPDITEEQIYSYFPHYHKLALKTNIVGAEKLLQDALLDFCRQYLMAHHYVPLDKQDNRIAYLCNVLLRVSLNRSTVAGWASVRLVDMIYHPQSLPDPEIKIYQVRDTTHEVLAKTSEIWKSLVQEKPAPVKPMEVAPYLLADSYGLEKLIHLSGIDLAASQKLRDLGEAYGEAANIFGQPPEPVMLAEAEGMVLSPAECDAGIKQIRALQQMKQIASEMLNEQSTRDKLLAGSDSLIEKIEEDRQQQLEDILRLANIGPMNLQQKRHRDLELEGAVRAPINEQQLLALYYGADSARYALETGLTDAQIRELHTRVSHYLTLSVRQQGLKRLSKKLKDIVLPLDPSVLHLVANELLTIDKVNPSTDPALAVLQYNHNLLLRPQQLSAIKDLLKSPASDAFSYQEEIKKIIMGGGKSKEILPAVAKSKATGTNLVVIEVPRALFETNCVDLSYSSGQLYNQKAQPFEFNRDSNCSPQSLEFIYAKLIDVIVGKDYLVTTGDSIQSLELKYLELVLQPPEEEEQRKIWASQIEWLDKIVSLFRTRADVLMDEVHHALLLKKKLNYTLGERRTISTTILNECVELYRFFDQVSLEKSLGEKFKGMTLSSFLQDHKSIMELMTENDHWEKMKDILAEALVNHKNSPLKQTLQRMGLQPTEEAELINYLSNKGTHIPKCVLRNEDSKILTIFALYKEQSSELLSQTLRRKLDVNYGASHAHPSEGVAIPYESNNKPLERSRFGNYLEAINFSIQMLLTEGAKPELMRRYLNQLQVLARQELINFPSIGSIDNTDSAKGLQALAPELGLTLSQIRLDDDEQFYDKVFNKIHKNKELLCEILKTEVLPQIRVESQILHSDAYNHVDIYRSVQGVTGTPSNSNTYHQRLSYHKHTAAATDGFILGLLKSKGTFIRPVPPTSSPKELLEQLFSGKVADESVRAIIDICATFRGISNIDVATELAAYVRLHPDIFAKPMPLQYIMFFNAENRLCALGINEGSKPIVIGSTEPEIINAKLGCTPDARFNYYDQEHTLGIDLKLTRKAKGLALVDRETTLEKAFQGFLREREFQDDQQIEIIVPASMADMGLDELIAQMAANEERQLQQDNFSAAQAKMTNVIRADFMRRLLALPNNDAEAKHRYAVAFKDYFVQHDSNDFFGLYGGLSVTRPAKDILEEQRERLLKDWAKTLDGLGEILAPTVPLKMRQDLDGIITNALPFCQKRYLSPTRQEHGKEVEVQKQVQVELQRETQLLREGFNPSLEPEPFQAWWPIEIGQQPYSAARNFITLTAMCRRSVPNAPDFGEMYVGPNYYKSYKRQTQYLGAFLKPVHAILFRQRLDGKLDCVLLSQQEAEQITSMMKSRPQPNIWLSTTQNTVLAGRAPDAIQENLAYQELIEKARFFNGEHKLILEGGMPINWLTEESAKKMTFFEQNLLPYRETKFKEMLTLRQALSQRQKAFRYIAEHPLDNYVGFEWHVHVSEELTDADIEECERLAAVFSYANAHWREKDLTREKCVQNQRLSLQALAYINRYYDDQLAILRDLFPLNGAGPVDEMAAVIDSLLPMLIKDFIPGVRSKNQMLLEFLLKKASTELDSQLLIRVADWLITMGGAEVDMVNVDGQNALELVLQADGEYIVEPMHWLIRKGANLGAVNKDVWSKIPAKTLDKLSLLGAFTDNESFVCAYVEAFKHSADKLAFIAEYATKSVEAMKLVIAVMSNPTRQFLSILLHSDLVETNPAVVKQFIQKVTGEERAWLVSRLLSTPTLSPDVLYAIIEENQASPVQFYHELIVGHGNKLTPDLLSAIVRALPVPRDEPFIEGLYTLLINILMHHASNEEVMAIVVHYALQLDEKSYISFWKTTLANFKWPILSDETLRSMVSTFSDELIDVLLNTKVFEDKQDDIIIRFLTKAGPALYQKLLKNKLFKPESRHFLTLLRGDSTALEPVLPQLVSHPSCDVMVLTSIIGVMGRAPSEDLVKALLASPVFIHNMALLRLYLEKVQGDACKLILKTLIERKGTASEALSLIIEFNSPLDLVILNLLIDRYGKELTAIQLEAILNQLLVPGANGIVAEGAAFLLNKLVMLQEANKVVANIVTYAMLFDANDLINFWRHDFSRLSWETLPSEILSKMLLHVPQSYDDVLFKLPRFVEHEKNIIDEFLKSASPRVYERLLLNAHVHLDRDQILTLLTLPAEQLQTVLPLVAKQPVIDLAILERVVELLMEPADANLLELLLKNKMFTSSDKLIGALLKKVTASTRSRIVAELTAIRSEEMESNVLTLLIKEGKDESRSEVARFADIMRDHPSELLNFHFSTMLKILSATEFEQKLLQGTIDLLRQILGHINTTPQTQQEAVAYAFKIRVPSEHSFWEGLSTLWWTDFDVETLCQLFTLLPKAVVNSLFASVVFKDDPEKLFNKFVLNKDVKVHLILLNLRQIKLTPKHLITMMGGLSHENLQSILPKIAAHPAADREVLNKVIGVMRLPHVELMTALMAIPKLFEDVSLVNQLWSIFAPTVGQKTPKSEAAGLMQKIMVNASTAQNTVVLESAVLYALQFAPQNLRDFWLNLGKCRWDQFSPNTLSMMLVCMPMELLDQLMLLPSFTANREVFIRKFIETNSLDAYDALLRSKNVGLQANHLLAILVKDKDLPLKQLFTKIVSLPAADNACLRHIIQLMALPPAEDLMRALLENNILKADAILLKQLMGKIGKEQAQRVITVLTSQQNLSDSVLTAVIENMSPLNFEGYHNCLVNYAGVLRENHLSAMVAAIRSPENMGKAPPVALMSKIIKHPSASVAVLTAMIKYAVQFDPEIVNEFWNEAAPLKWDRIDDATLKEMFLKLQNNGLDLLLNSTTYKQYKENIISRVKATNDARIYSLFIENTHARLRKYHLKEFLEKLPRDEVQAILPLVARHLAADQSICDQVIELMDIPTIELLLALLENDQFKPAIEVIDRLARCGNPDIYRVLLLHEKVQLETRHLFELITTVDEVRIQSILPEIARHTQATDVMLSAVIDQLKEPAEELFQVLLVKPSLLTNASLARQLLEKVSKATCQRLVEAIALLPAVHSTVLTVIIERNNPPDISVYNNILTTHAAKLDESHLAAIVRSISSIPMVEQKAIAAAIELMGCVVSSGRVGSIVVNQAIEYVLKFNLRYTQSFWAILNEDWSKIEAGVLARMFLKFQGQLEILISSRYFAHHSTSVIDKLLQSGNRELYHLLLDTPKMQLRSRHLISLLTGADSDLLEKIAGHAEADLFVLQQLIEVLENPTDVLIETFLNREEFFTNQDLVKSLLQKVVGVHRDKILAALRDAPDVSVDVLQVLIDENKSNVRALKTIFDKNRRKLRPEQLKTLLPTDDVQLQAWRNHHQVVAELLTAILNHAEADNRLTKAVMDCAVAIIPAGAKFWEVIPKKVDKVDLSRNKLGHKLDEDLKKIFQSLTKAAEVDLSNNNLGEKDKKKLAEILATLPANVRRLNVSGNHIDRAAMPFILKAIPPSVTTIAYERDRYLPRAELTAQFTDHSFLLNCLASVALVAGAAALIVGIIALNALLIGVGTVVVATVLGGALLAKHGMFCCRPQLSSTDKTEEVLSPGAVIEAV